MGTITKERKNNIDQATNNSETTPLKDSDSKDTGSQIDSDFENLKELAVRANDNIQDLSKDDLKILIKGLEQAIEKRNDLDRNTARRFSASASEIQNVCKEKHESLDLFFEKLVFQEIVSHREESKSSEPPAPSDISLGLLKRAKNPWQFKRRHYLYLLDLLENHKGLTTDTQKLKLMALCSTMHLSCINENNDYIHYDGDRQWLTKSGIIEKLLAKLKVFSEEFDAFLLKRYPDLLKILRGTNTQTGVEEPFTTKERTLFIQFLPPNLFLPPPQMQKGLHVKLMLKVYFPK